MPHLAKIFEEILVQFFHDDSFFGIFFSFFALIGFDLYYIGLMASYCVCRPAKKFCVSLCFEVEGTFIRPNIFCIYFRFFSPIFALIGFRLYDIGLVAPFDEQ